MNRGQDASLLRTHSCSEVTPRHNKVHAPRKKYKRAYGLIPIIVALTLTAVYNLVIPPFLFIAVTIIPDFLFVLLRPKFSSYVGQGRMNSFTAATPNLPQGTTSLKKFTLWT